jgi:hypothetical protein
MARWLDDHPRHRHGVHRYAAEEFGLSQEEILRRLGGYVECFSSLVAS